MSRVVSRMRQLLEHPRTCGMDIDDPRLAGLRRQVLQEKPFLRRIYEEWYRSVAAAVPDGRKPVLEIGSGGGFLRDFVPGLVTSDVVPGPNIDRVLDACELPSDEPFRAIVMTDVFHHLPDCRRFLSTSAACVPPGGTVVMFEPWITPWSRFVFHSLHHEPMDLHTARWEFEPGGPLSAANIALPWIVFHRDRQRFEREFPQWQVECIRRTMPFRYLVSGGIAYRSLMPGFSFPLWRFAESLLAPFFNQLAMFALIVLRRTSAPVEPEREVDAPS